MFNSITLCFISFLGGGMIGMGTVLFVQDAFYNENKIEEKEIKVRLTNQDFEHLNKLVKESNLSRESYLRMCINGLLPRPAPSKELIEVIKILREIAEKMNQIAISVYTQNAMDKSFYMENYEKLQDQINEIMILIRQPINMEEVWQLPKYGQ